MAVRGVCALLAWCGLAAAQSIEDRYEWGEQSPCLSGTRKYKKFSFRVVNKPPEPIFVGELGLGPSVRIFCMDIMEDPMTALCDSGSIPVVCRNSVEDGNCERLSQYVYGTGNQNSGDDGGEVVVGGREDNDAHWMLLWDPREKPALCYPREVYVRVVYQIESLQGQSTVVAVVAIILVSILVLAVCAFGLSRLLSKIKQQKEARRRAAGADSGHEFVSGDVALELGNYFACPKCRQCQAVPMKGDNPLEEIACSHCGVTSMGWVPVDRAGPAEDPRYPQRGYSTVQISNRHDPAADAALGMHAAGPAPPAKSYPPELAYSDPAAPFSDGPAAAPPPFFTRADPNADAVFAPPPRVP